MERGQYPQSFNAEFTAALDSTGMSWTKVIWGAYKPCAPYPEKPDKECWIDIMTPRSIDKATRYRLTMIAFNESCRMAPAAKIVLRFFVQDTLE